MATSIATFTVTLTVAHPDGTRITYTELSRRIRRLLEEYESGAQLDDFYLTKPTITNLYTGKAP